MRKPSFMNVNHEELERLNQFLNIALYYDDKTKKYKAIAYAIGLRYYISRYWAGLSAGLPENYISANRPSGNGVGYIMKKGLKD